VNPSVETTLGLDATHYLSTLLAYNGAADIEKMTDPTLTLYETSCAICGVVLQQITPDDPEDRPICYGCYEEMWGKRIVPKRHAQRACAGSN
jgi:hypothetical protein